MGVETQLLITTGSLVVALFWIHSHLWLGQWDGWRDVWNISLRGLQAGQQLGATGSGTAVDLISPMGLHAGKGCLIWYTCATSCLSHCLALWRAVGAWRERRARVCVFVSILCMCEDSWRALLPCNDLPDPECSQCSLEVVLLTFRLYDSNKKNLGCCWMKAKSGAFLSNFWTYGNKEYAAMHPWMCLAHGPGVFANQVKEVFSASGDNPSANRLCVQVGCVGMCERSEALPSPYTLSLINSPVVTDWPSYTCTDMPELLAALSRENNSFDLNPPLVSNLTTG